MSDIATLMMKIEADTRQFESKMEKTKKGLSNVGKVAVLAGVAIVGAFGAKSLQAATDFEKQMASVATLLDGDVNKRVGELSEEVKNLAIATGTGTEVITDGLYQVVSAFGDTADASKILEIATKGAVAGNATVTDSVNLLSAVTKGYGDTSAESAQKVSDLAFLTVKLGQTTFPELASSMGRVIPLASTMGVSMEELFGMMSTLTGVTGGTAEVTTQLRGVIQGFIKPTAEMTTQMEKLGYATGMEMIESMGLVGSLDALKGAVNGNETALANLFGSVEAVNAVLALTGSQADVFVAKYAQMMESAGATNEAFEVMSATFDMAKARIGQAIKVITIDVGEKLLPVFARLADWVESNMPKIREVIGAVLEAISTAIQGVVDGFNEYFRPTIEEIAYMVKENLPEIKEIFQVAFDKIKEVVMVVWGVFKESLLPILLSVFDFIRVNFPAMQDTAVRVFGLIGDAVNLVKKIIETFFIPILEKMFGKMGETDGVASAFQIAFDIINGVINVAITTIETLIGWLEKAVEWYGKLKKAMSGNEGSTGTFTGSTYRGSQSKDTETTEDKIAISNIALRDGVDIGVARAKYKWGGAMADGGIVDKPTIALIGEAGREAVIPLDKGGVGNNITINVRSPFDVAKEIDFIQKKLAWGLS